MPILYNNANLIFPLDPCPLCGCAEINMDIAVGQSNSVTAICAGCGLRLTKETRDELITTWNRRYAPPRKRKAPEKHTETTATIKQEAYTTLHSKTKDELIRYIRVLEHMQNTREVPQAREKKRTRRTVNEAPHQPIIRESSDDSGVQAIRNMLHNTGMDARLVFPPNSHSITIQPPRPEQFQFHVVPEHHRETFRERLAREHPDKISVRGRCSGCPTRYGYEEEPYCVREILAGRSTESLSCRECWDREIPEEADNE